eukprot:CAMPEP_0176391542 /NCGR_PEP_ID=MMETSP0126-20121128/40115_1 /TAXON_ID=141414 ORGANISM="Strombidinopsis acuminatum, Strain SPMC142" /NCGR_SAMPLE_ID=MMETSP0126 /ASSEMBLY_ACC=CAM_ASM_000229 /LENGTH=115 /DNA_ID=CAMNT_0017761729 /DNA_START=113 /DNA_END=460 /DNA_ORIENTATION=+
MKSLNDQEGAKQFIILVLTILELIRKNHETHFSDNLTIELSVIQKAKQEAQEFLMSPGNSENGYDIDLEAVYQSYDFSEFYSISKAKLKDLYQDEFRNHPMFKKMIKRLLDLEVE